MKNKVLIKTLSDFSPNSEVKVVIDGTPHDLIFDGWEGTDMGEGLRDIDNEKLQTSNIYFTIKDETEK